jgi:DNA-binding XRE family transcriptional regulator
MAIGDTIITTHIYIIASLTVLSISLYMRSAVRDLIPPHVRRSLAKLGADLSLARRKRTLTVSMMAERLGVSRATYTRMEKGDPSVALGAYAQALFVLGFGAILGDLIDQRKDDQGLLLDADRVPKRVRITSPTYAPSKP